MSDKFSVKATTHVLSPTTEATLELGQKLIVETFASYNEFAKTLISLSSTFIPLYLGIVAFLGIEIPQSALHRVFLVISPSLLFIISCIISIISFLPRERNITLDNPQDLARTLVKSLRVKRRYILIGSGFFLVGLLLIIVLILLSI